MTDRPISARALAEIEDLREIIRNETDTDRRAGFLFLLATLMEFAPEAKSP